MRVLILCLALLVALLASGCATVKGVPVAGDGPAPSLPESTTTPPAPEPATNERGFIPAEIGEELCYGPIDSDTCEGGVTFSVDKIAIDPPCMEFGQRTGHTLVVSMRVATGTDTESNQMASGVFNPFSFIVIGKNGVSQDADFGMCTDLTSNPDTYGPNQKYAFKIELDVPVVHGVLALQPGIVGLDGAGGWEWPF
ncbi:MAG: hypothetical protein ACRDSK_09300 [Actinophytocola sp.]|uniref:hypothetical protein n=1 Tax=Actinophytocola sp. TaxID=1872138 RepID=UPI003D6A81A0